MSMNGTSLNPKMNEYIRYEIKSNLEEGRIQDVRGLSDVLYILRRTNSISFFIIYLSLMRIKWINHYIYRFINK